MPRRRNPAFGLVLALVAGAADGVEFRRVVARPGLLAAQALAWDPAQQVLAVGDAEGLALHRLGAPGAARRGFRGAVHALAFTHAGTLLLGSERGLWRLNPGAASAERVPLAPGAAGQPVSRIAVARRHVAVAAAGGLYWSAEGERFVALRDELPAGPPLALALRAEPDAELAVAWVDALWRVKPDGAPPRELPLRLAAEDPPQDLAFDAHGALWLLRGRQLERHADGRVETQPLPLPPGARASRLLVVADRVVVSSDRGVLIGELPALRWQPLALAGESVAALAAADAEVFAATRSGIHGWQTASKPPARTAANPIPDRDHAPIVAALHRAALAAQGLAARHEAALREGVDRRGWLPELELRAGLARGRRRFRDHDQIWSGGELRELYDYGGDGDTEYDVSLHLAWDLGDLRFHPEAIDVSRETRARIELRDEVLDEVTRLYFDREQRLAERAALPPGAHAERARLAREAAALAAGLDAWTGGAFTRLAGAPVTRLPRPDVEESR